MKRILLILTCALLTCCTLMAKTPKAPEVTLVSIEGEGVGNGGRPLLTVTCSAKKADKVTDDELRRCAVSGILFRGYSDRSRSGMIDSSTNHQALCKSDAEAAHADYFQDFFEGGAANSFVDIVPDTRKVTRNWKNYYVSQSVRVNVPALRKKLEKDGIIKSLRGASF